MTRRPTGLIILAVWLTLAILVNYIPMIRALTGYSGPTATAPPQFVLLELGLLAFAVVLVVNLLRMRSTAIWLTVALLALSAVMALLRIPAFLSKGFRPVAWLFATLWIGLEVGGVYYLSRPAFHALAKGYRTERDQEAMRRYADKAVRRIARP